MGQVGDLIGAQGAAAAGMLGPAEHPGLEEGAIDDQLTAALEQIEQAYLALGSVELGEPLQAHILMSQSRTSNVPIVQGPHYKTCANLDQDLALCSGDEIFVRRTIKDMPKTIEP
jgi:hypothetical protein